MSVSGLYIFVCNVILTQDNNYLNRVFNKMFIRVYFGGFMTSLILRLAAGKDCLTTNACSCGFDDGSGSVDLTSIGKTDQTPRFKDILVDADKQYYSYSPCGGFTEGDCQNAAACMSDSSLSQQTQIGDAATPNFQYDDSAQNVIVTYTSGQSTPMSTTVSLICDQTACTPSFTVQGENPSLPNEYDMTLTTVCACPNMCNANGPINCGGGGGDSSSISVGSIILIIFVSMVMLYFMLGSLYMAIFKKSRGLQVIPNSSLWFSVPGLIRDGFGCIVGTVCRRKGYSSV